MSEVQQEVPAPTLAQLKPGSLLDKSQEVDGGEGLEHCLRPSPKRLLLHSPAGLPLFGLDLELLLSAAVFRPPRECARWG